MIPPMISQMLMSLLNNEIKAYAQLTSLQLDTEAKQISITANLVGETAPIDAKINYRIQEADGRTYVVPLELQCSREWLTQISQPLLKYNSIRFEIPQGIASTALKMLKL